MDRIGIDQINFFFWCALQVYAELEAIVDKLATDSQRGSYTMKKITGEPSDCE